MRHKVSTSLIQMAALCCFLVAGPTRSSADEPPGPAIAEFPMPNMICKPASSKQNGLPPSEWNDCVGAFTFANGNVYRGEFRHGMRTGIGVLTIKYIGTSDFMDIGWNEPALYIGKFRRGRLNGYGLLIGNSGVAYAGMFKDNLAQSDLHQKECRGESSATWTDCIGTYRYPSGNVYRGEFSRGRPNGIGMLEIKALGRSDGTRVRLPVPGVYVGHFRNGKLSGHGAVVMSGAGYFGTFSDNRLKKSADESARSRNSGAVAGD